MRYWLLTGALVLAGVGLVLGIAPDAPALRAAVRGYPLALLAAVVLVAWRFQRSRLAWAAVLLATTWAALALLDPGKWPDLFAALTILLPLAFAGLAVTDDRPLGSPRGLMQLVLAVGVPATGVALVGARLPGIGDWLWLLRAPPVAADPLSLSRPAMIAFVVAFSIAGVLLARRRRPGEAGLLLVLVPLLLMLDAMSSSGPAAAAWLLAAGGVLALAVVESAFALAYHDELTGLPSRRALVSALGELRAPYAIAVVDIDWFKLVNDRYGHETGDQVLRMVAARLARARDGRAFRSGGEEFTLLFPGLDAAEAHDRMEEVRVAIAEKRFRLRGADRPRKKPAGARPGSGRKSASTARELAVTVSAGVASASEAEADPELVVAAADRGLYTAKRAGRNRTVAPRASRARVARRS